MNNNCTGNKSNGVLIEHCDKLSIVSGNISQNNGEAGVYVLNSDQCNLFANTFGRNETDGIVVQESGEIFMKENICDENGRIGIYLYRCNSIIISDNRVSQSKASGILLNETECLVENNHSKNNEECGIYFHGGDSKSNEATVVNTNKGAVMYWFSVNRTNPLHG